MNWVPARAVALAVLLGSAVLVSAAMAARLPTSTLVVQVLSVDQESFRREPAMVSQGNAVGEQRLETTGFVAKVQIQNVIQSDHGLAPGQTIEVHYTIRTATPRPRSSRDTPLEPGKNMTLTVMKGNGGYELRR
jgi:hypothetical protein